QRLGGLTSLVNLAQRGEISREEAQIPGVAGILLSSFATPPSAFLVLTSDIKGDAEAGVREEDMRIQRRKAQPLLGAPNRFSSITQVAVRRTAPRPGDVATRIRLDGPVEHGDRFGELVSQE